MNELNSAILRLSSPIFSVNILITNVVTHVLYCFQRLSFVSESALVRSVFGDITVFSRASHRVCIGLTDN